MEVKLAGIIILKTDKTREVCRRKRMIRKSGNRFSEKIILKQINESGGA